MTGMRTPDVLVVHLRRFEQTGTQARKIPGIRFGNILSLSHWTDNLEDDYRLDAVIQHYGDSIDTGHYDCSRAAQGGYIRFNDEEVTFHPEPLESVFENAYMLIFSRKSVAPELPLFSQQVITNYSQITNH
jgi:ubiquitin C-terminal hydrolase